MFAAQYDPRRIYARRFEPAGITISTVLKLCRAVYEQFRAVGYAACRGIRSYKACLEAGWQVRVANAVNVGVNHLAVISKTL